MSASNDKSPQLSLPDFDRPDRFARRSGSKRRPRRNPFRIGHLFFGIARLLFVITGGVARLLFVIARALVFAIANVARGGIKGDRFFRHFSPKALSFLAASFIIIASVALLSAGIPPDSIAHNAAKNALNISLQESLENDRKIYKKPNFLQVSPAPPLKRVVHVKNGEGMMETLRRAGVSRSDAHAIIQAISEHINLRKLSVGQRLDLVFPHHEDNKRIDALAMELGGGKSLRATRMRQGGWSAHIRAQTLQEREDFATNRIDSSLFNAAQQAGLPLSVTTEFIRVYSHMVDFQRDIRKGDTFEVFFSHEYDRDGNPAHNRPHLLYLSMSVQGKQIQLWRHKDPETGVLDYFDDQGRSMRRLLMRTPIDGARLSSGFGMRKHPILGYSRMHRGLDFAAPTGTPIYASGNGVVTQIGSHSGYGKTIRLRHANGYATLYAHLSRYAKGLGKGSRVEQGETIGYVGSTGLSTGPHLHYEVHLRGKSLDPYSLDIPLGRVLEGVELADFHEARGELGERVLLAATEPLAPASRVASR